MIFLIAFVILSLNEKLEGDTDAGMILMAALEMAAELIIFASLVSK